MNSNRLSRAWAALVVWGLLATGLRAADLPNPADGRPHRFEIGPTDFLIDGQRIQIRCGEIHFARVPREYWSHRLKAIKAMGLNAVCAYLFWNYHEWEPGKFDWQGQRDAAEFCRLAQQEGLWVILRPGPYACAEWENGGLPWWLLKHPGDNFLRSRDPAFMGPARDWLHEVGRVLAPLQITRGGPILMVQVENEYGFLGTDAEYMHMLQRILNKSGFDIPLFDCNPTSHVKRGHIPGIFSVANFGKDPAKGFAALAEVQQGPAMCGEFYPGWFDTWGAPHHRGKMVTILRDLGYMLDHDGSFSLYMVHGGTTFGLWGGADRPFRPDTTSYDYDAPITEAGWTGEKFAQFRAAIQPHLLPGETLPDPPAPLPVIEIPPFALTETAPVRGNLPAAVRTDASPRPIEEYDISRGLISYRATLPAGFAGRLDAARVRDLAWVFVDGRLAGTMDARYRRYQLELPARERPAQLEILVYTIARVNFGVEVHDRLGLHGPVRFTPKGGRPEAIGNWQIRAIDFRADASLPALRWQTGPAPGPAFWRGTFSVAATGDTFLDVSKWGLGVVWVNGRCLGRYWNIGPTQTMYLPAPWLKPGANEIVVLDLTGPAKAEIAGLKLPVLDELHPEKDFSPRHNQAKFVAGGRAATHEGRFASGSEAQEIHFARPASGRQFCLESVDAYDGKGAASAAEIQLLDARGQLMEESGWTIAYADSEEGDKEDGSALNAIDGQVSDQWVTAWSDANSRSPHPHRLVIDLGAETAVSGFRYTPRQGDDETPGRIRNYRIYVGDHLVDPTVPE